LRTAASHQQHAHGGRSTANGMAKLFAPFWEERREAPGRRKRRAIHYDPRMFFGSGTAASLGPPATVLFLALCEHANRKGENTFKVSDNSLAADSSYSPRTICDARKLLQERGLITCSRADGASYVYTLQAYSFEFIRVENRRRKKKLPRANYGTRKGAP